MVASPPPQTTFCLNSETACGSIVKRDALPRLPLGWSASFNTDSVLYADAEHRYLFENGIEVDQIISGSIHCIISDSRDGIGDDRSCVKIIADGSRDRVFDKPSRFRTGEQTVRLHGE